MKNIGQKNLVAFSGGVDSTVLLHQLVELRKLNPEIQLRAVHVNHQLSPNAEAWEAHCKVICKNLNISFESIKVDASSEPGESPEDAARKARYSVFEKMIERDECLLTAHNADDQAETVLLQLLRGAGPKGLAAMPEKKVFHQGFHARPLLEMTRDDILTYANDHNLTWVEDETNYIDDFDRNYLRNHIFPALMSRWPKLSKTFSQSASNCADANYLLEKLAQEDADSCVSELNAFNIDVLNELSVPRKKNVIRYVLREKFNERISANKLNQIITISLKADEDKTPLVELEKHDIRRFKNSLVITPKLIAHNPDIIISWDLSEPLALPSGLGTLHPKDFDIKTDDNVTVRFRSGGEKCQPEGRKETHSLKKLFQEWGVPPWLRDRVPLLYVSDTLVYVVGYCKCVSD